MLQAFRNALVIPDLRRKLLVTIGLLGVYRLMVHIPTPGVDIEALQGGALSSDIFSLLNFISGGNFEVFSIAALGVIPGLRRKLLVTIGLLGVYRLMVHIPTPGVDIEALQGGALSSDIFSLLNFISGGNFEVFSIAALGVIPYITASIIIQLLTSTY